MPSTYSSNLRIQLIASGEQANQWGITTNTNLGTLIEQAIAGLASIDVTAGNVTLTALNGVSDQSRQMVLSITGTPGVSRQILAPAVSKVYVVANDSDSDVEIITTAVGSSGVTVTSGIATMVYSDGVDFFTANDTVLATYAPNVAVITDALGVLTGSAVTDTELGYLSGATSNIQTQINNVAAGSKFAPINFVLSL
jgi:hypothetical protein